MGPDSHRPLVSGPGQRYIKRVESSSKHKKDNADFFFFYNRKIYFMQ